MYCKAITNSGWVCCNTTLTNDIHCRVHNKEYEECSVCMGNVYVKTTLGCGHSFCSECAIKWCGLQERSCPLCRKDDYLFILDKKSIPLEVASYLMGMIHNQKDNYTNVLKLFDHIFKNQQVFFSDPEFSKILTNKTYNLPDRIYMSFKKKWLKKINAYADKYK